MIAGIVGVGLLAALRLTEASAMLVVLSAALQLGLALTALNALLGGTRSAAGPQPDARPLPDAGSRRGFLARAAVLGGSRR